MNAFRVDNKDLLLKNVIKKLVNEKNELERKIELAFSCAISNHNIDYIYDAINKLVVCEQSIEYVKGRLNENVNV